MYTFRVDEERKIVYGKVTVFFRYPDEDKFERMFTDHTRVKVHKDDKWSALSGVLICKAKIDTRIGAFILSLGDKDKVVNWTEFKNWAEGRIDARYEDPFTCSCSSSDDCEIIPWSDANATFQKTYIFKDKQN